ncbi:MULTISPECIES: tRNA lysidine(34) synthetase TilS [unclassified Coleofasciculus]|uniref:tRNA lysidine(34) synthetase TilS n=1 Tax=unclassified Coleofasciculus TaxID=2692782 RepID=UPI001880A4CF|nr:MULTISPECIES: tRNA lysidine(34) synthetase TilS [unclassified Coleofasciculus]MBE9124691.1 tRNA lysidine(34) synthetase TilS [Coleofasciculus sp. LEGE 07081]MBE9147018.1 tRNA lysidine(34) synthetase TilS [Coleofasciculus sp. LEGE 07092]
MAENPSWTYLHARLHQTLRQRRLLNRHRRVLVAVSGGQDSLCLMKLLLDLQPKWEWHLAIAHCDHRWPKDTGLAFHVQQLAQGWSVPFYLETAPEVTQSESAARQWRYQALSEVALSQGYPDVVTGHTQSDRAETVLYNLIRGTGGDGLQSLTWQRPLAPGVQLVRPLLNVTRAETFQFCQQQHLPIWEDAYNQDLNYTRNRIRQELLPYLKTHFNPQVERALAHTAELLRAEVDYLESAAQQLRQQAMASVSKDDPDTLLKLNRLVLRQAPLALQRRAIRQFLVTAQPTAPSFEQIEAITALINAPNRSRTSSFPGGAVAQVERNWIIFRTTPN